MHKSIFLLKIPFLKLSLQSVKAASDKCVLWTESVKDLNFPSRFSNPPSREKESTPSPVWIALLLHQVVTDASIGR